MPPKKHSPVNKHVWKVYHLLNRSVMLHGPTGTGKSRCSLFLCDLIKDYIDVVAAACPTNDLHHDWTGKIPEFLITKTLSTSWIENIITTQEKKKDLVTTADDIGGAYWKMIPGHKAIDDEYAAKIAEIDANTEKNKTLFTGDDYSRVKFEKYDAEYTRNKKSRELITKYSKDLFKKFGVAMGDKKDQDSIKLTIFSLYYRLNCNMLLIIDDCTDQFIHVDDATWKKLYTKLRHFNITLLMTTHSLNDIKGQVLRTSPFWHVFTTPGHASYFLNNATTGVKGIISPSMSDLENAFSLPKDQEQTHMRKVTISRDLGQIYSFTFPLQIDFQLGTKSIWKVDKMLAKNKQKEPMAIDARMF